MEQVQDGTGRIIAYIASEPGEEIVSKDYTYRKYIQEKVSLLNQKIGEAQNCLNENDCMGLGILLEQMREIVDTVGVNCHFVTPAMLDLKVESNQRLRSD